MSMLNWIISRSSTRDTPPLLTDPMLNRFRFRRRAIRQDGKVLGGALLLKIPSLFIN